MEARLTPLRQSPAQKKFDAFLITNPVSRRYLSGFDGTSGALLIGGEEAFLLTDFRYTEQAAAQAPQFAVRNRLDDLHKSLAELIEEAGWSRIGFESKHIDYATYREMKEKLPAKLIACKDVVEKQRMIKSPAELDILRRGAELLDRGFNYICDTIRPGMSEAELALDLEFYLRREGAQGASFRYIVASGKRGAMPHGVASDKILEEGDPVTIDFGAVYEGYATDMTRTICLGRADERLREIYAVVGRAQEKGVAAVCPGQRGSEVDAVARRIIEEAGYGEHFGHGLGHGIGLETHELPVLNKLSATVLKPGMVVTVEPGIYIPGWGGVRIEDMVVVTAGGVERLTHSPRQLLEIQR